MSQLLESDNETRPSLLPFAFARRFGVAITTTDGAQPVDVAYRKPPDLTVLAELRRFAGAPIALRSVSDEEFESILSATYSRDSSQARQMVEDIGDELDLASLANSVPETEDLLEKENDAPIIRLINALLTEAVKQNASDIHIETFERRLIVRFRVDGVLREVVQPKRELAPLLVSRIKVMAKLDIAEKRVPQDGRISLRVGGRDVDIRVSTLPSNAGERVVLRLLDKEAGRLNLDVLGMPEVLSPQLIGLLNRPHGILLVTGPTGSGKTTTTLYAGLSEINDKTRNILTVEDPDRIQHRRHRSDASQRQGGHDLRSWSARDATAGPGRRDDRRNPRSETADIAVQASLTGHLVLSTLHTNTAVGAITRLRDMGIEPFLLASSLVGVLAQRFVRVLCPDCREQVRADSFECQFLGIDYARAPTIYRGAGCELCGHSGFRGRVGIYELVVVDDALRERIHDRASEQELTRHVRKTCPGIREDGRDKVLSGVTTVQEMLRVTLED